ncbi:unnamed protein product [Allacma fusca]|uniref:Farnesyl pyrophosphate synthase n=1 Tax=Allacma fusca TaxID=39272 RepID=A0A8J2LTN1_9HEXA|nr:unnamed protein product [Allacma fusca]
MRFVRTEDHTVEPMVAILYSFRCEKFHIKVRKIRGENLNGKKIKSVINCLPKNIHTAKDYLMSDAIYLHHKCHKSSSSTSASGSTLPRVASSQPQFGGGLSELIRKLVTSQKVVETYRRRMEETKLLGKEERADFDALFPVLVDDLTGSKELQDMPETNRWMRKVLEYNVPFGKQNRGLSLALAYRYLAKDLSRDNIQLSYVLGWCVEFLQAFFLVADDIMDSSETRRGRLCWYKVDGLGATAFNDAVLLEASVYPILKKYFREKEYYADLLDIFHEATFKTSYGQSLDTRTGLEKRLETYTVDRYAAIVKYKTSYYSFYLPVSLAMAMAGVRDNKTKEQARTLLLEMGHFFQVQDDYLDCFGDTDITGKIGTDIADCKCSWLVVAALQKANPAQRHIIMENYGQNDPEKIEIIKHLYMDMGIPELYLDFEEQTYSTINKHIEQMSPSLPKRLFRDMIDKLYRRSS